MPIREVREQIYFNEEG